MSLIEALRNRRILIIFAIVFGCIVIFNAIAIGWGVHHAVITQRAVDASHPSPANESGATIHISVAPGPDSKDDDFAALAGKDFGIPVGLLFGIASFVALAFATIVGTSLNKENTLGGFAFTKPLSRERLALTYFAVDAVSIVAAFALAVVLGLVALVILGILGRLYVDRTALSIAALGLGVSVMWYGMLQALTAGMRFRAGMFIGIGWGLFSILAALHGVVELGPTFHAVVATLNYLNPLAYYTSLSMSGSDVTTSSLLGLSEPLRLLIPYSIGIIGCAIAIAGWKRVEV
jgi:hypothetical protein